VNTLHDISDRIRAGYAREERDAGPVTTLDRLPLTYDHLTPDWLTALLCADRPDVRVAGFEAVEADDLGRGHVRISLSYTNPAPDLPETVFCKDAQRLQLRLFNAFLVEGEAQFYRAIQPALGVETPECLFAGFDPETYNSLLIFRDLREHGLEFCTEALYVTRALAESQIRHVARVHARFAGEMDANPLMTGLRTFPEVFDRVCHLFQGEFGAAVLRGFEVAESVIPEGLRARRDRVWPAIEAAFAEQLTRPPTLTHNDSHIDNWYPTPAGELRLGDWQIVARGDYAFDLAQIISTSLTVDDRRAWEHELVELYVQEVAAHGGPALDLDAVRAAYRAQLVANLSWWTPTLARSVDFDFHDQQGTLEVIRRVTTAIDDHDALR
jgi:hypothetical protein